MGTDPQNSPVLERLQTLLASTNSILLDTKDETIRRALATASLKLIIDEAQRVMGSLGSVTAGEAAAE